MLEATTAKTRGTASAERLLDTYEPSGLQADHPRERRGHLAAASIDDHAEELEVEGVGRWARRLHLRAVGAAGLRARAAVLVAGRARSAVAVVAVLPGAELVDRPVLAPPARVEGA